MLHPAEEQTPEATDDQCASDDLTSNHVEAWPLISESKGNVTPLSQQVTDQSQPEVVASVLAAPVPAGLGECTTRRLDATHQVPFPAVDVPANDSLRRTVRDVRLLDSNGNFSMSMNLALTLPHDCASWCTGDLAALDDIELTDVNATLPGLPAEQAHDLADTVLLVEGDHDDLLRGHDLSGFGVYED